MHGANASSCPFFLNEMFFTNAIPSTWYKISKVDHEIFQTFNFSVIEKKIL